LIASQVERITTENKKKQNNKTLKVALQRRLQLGIENGIQLGISFFLFFFEYCV